MAVEGTCEVESTLASLTYSKNIYQYEFIVMQIVMLFAKKRVFVFRYGLHISSIFCFRNDAIGVR